MVVHAVATNDKGIIGGSEDLDFAVDLAADGVLVVAVDDFHGVDLAGGAVANHVDRAAAADADAADAFDVREVWG